MSVVLYVLHHDVFTTYFCEIFYMRECWQQSFKWLLNVWLNVENMKIEQKWPDVGRQSIPGNEAQLVQVQLWESFSWFTQLHSTGCIAGVLSASIMTKHVGADITAFVGLLSYLWLSPGGCGNLGAWVGCRNIYLNSFKNCFWHELRKNILDPFHSFLKSFYPWVLT